MGFSRRFDKEKLGGDGGGAESRDDGVLAFESTGEGVEGVVVDCDRGDGGGQGIVAAFASEDGDFEASVDQFGEDSWAKIAGSLKGDGMSASRMES